MASKKIVLIGLNSAWNLINFRLGLVHALLQRGYTVKVFSPYDSKHVKYIREIGCEFIPMDIQPRGLNLFQEIQLLTKFLLVFRKHRPDFYLGFTIKPNIYGAIAAAIFKVKSINNISGLGASFIGKSWLTTLVAYLYRFALQSSERVFFQNKDDMYLFVENKIIHDKQAGLLPGSGIDLFKFQPFQRSANRDYFQFLFVGRLIPDKGFIEFVKAAQIIKSEFNQVKFVVLGALDQSKNGVINQRQIDDWVAKDLIKYLGHSDTPSGYINDADCIVLPSYREGTPRALLEAAAMAKPIVATDVAGCRDVVIDGVNGFLCLPKDPIDLAKKMVEMIMIGEERRNLMGEMGRQRVENYYDERFVVNAYLRELV